MNSPLLVAFNTLRIEHPSATKNTVITLTQLLDHYHTHPNPTLRFVTTYMMLRIHSDVACISVSKARSRAAGFFYLSSDTETPPLNGTVHVLCVI